MHIHQLSLKKEKFFLFERKSRGIEEKYKLTKSILNCPEADMLGNKEIMSNFFEKITYLSWNCFDKINNSFNWF